MPPFQYTEAQSIDEAVALLSRPGAVAMGGGTKTIKVDVRVIAATNSDMEADIEAGKFRADLYDRLAFETIWLPPLRDRKEDIELLSYHFMERLAGEVADIKPKRLAPETLEHLNAYDWPGNVRELKYVIERITYKVDGDTISPHHLPQEILTAYSRTGDGETLSNRLAQVEKQILMDVYEQCQGDLENIARQLSTPLESLKQLMQKHQIGE